MRVRAAVVTAAVLLTGFAGAANAVSPPQKPVEVPVSAAAAAKQLVTDKAQAGRSAKIDAARGLRGGTCYSNHAGNSIRFNPNGLSLNYVTSNCTGKSHYPVGLVKAGNGMTADALCGEFGEALPLSAFGFNSPSDIWVCTD